MGTDAATADNPHNRKKLSTDRTKVSAGRDPFHHERDTCDCEGSDKTPKKEKTDLATYPVGSKVAGESA